MSRLAATLAAIARHEVARHTWCELGRVVSVFDDADGPDSQTVTIELKESGAVLPRVPVAVWATGAAGLPREGDVVVVVFPRGDLASAIVLAQVYTDQRRPPTFTKDELALVWPGDTDDPDAGAVELRIKADGSDRSVTVKLGGDKDACVALKDGAVELKSGGVTLSLSHGSSTDGAVLLSAGGTRIELSQDGDLSVISAGKLTLKGTEVAIEGDTKVKINGQIVELN